MRDMLRDLFTKLMERPPVFWAAVGGVITMLGGNVEALAPYEPLMMLLLPIAFGYLASRFTTGPETGRVLAEAVQKLSAQALKNPDGPIESIAPSLPALRAAERVLNAKPPIKEARR